MAVFLVGIVAAMVLTQHLRSEGPVATHILLRYKPRSPDRVCFEIPRDDTFEVALVDDSGATVRILAEDARLRGDPSLGEDARHCFDWDGRDDAGRPAPPGAYRLRVTLADAGRVATSGERLVIPLGTADGGAG